MGGSSDGTLAGADRQERRWLWAFGLLLAASAALLFAFRANIGFFIDDWMLIFFRHGASDWLLPHHDHPIMIPAALYDLSLSVFGMEPMPLHLVALALFLASVVMLFQWIRTLVGTPAAVLGCAVVLLLGSSTEDLIWTFQIGFCGSAVTGLGALLLLRRENTGSDALACLLLVASFLLSTLAMPFLVGAAVQLCFRGGNPGLRRMLRDSWIVLVPLLLYGIWLLGWNQSGGHAATLENALKTPFFVLSAFGYGSAALTGTFPLRLINDSYLWSIAGLAVAAGFAWILQLRRRIPPEFLIALAAGLTFWILCGLNFTPGRDFFTGRYQYPSVIFILMMLAGACAGLRPDRNWLKWLTVLAAASIAVNIFALFYTFNHTIKPFEQVNIVTLAAFKLSGDAIDPDFQTPIGTGDDAPLTVPIYRDAVARYGPPAFTESDIDSATADYRSRLDQLLVPALRIGPEDGLSVTPVRSTCETVTADAGATDTAPVAGPLLYIRPARDAVVRLTRFGPAPGAPAWLV
ncbi:MAG TPA: hypothetical protein PKA65_12565, partial [Solirubrobacterales bacterium]|nr:hypothetical protein [Solirubrobacterales bacterium]